MRLAPEGVRRSLWLVLTLAGALWQGAQLQAADQADKQPAISGELRKWHRVTLTWEGPQTSETANPNPFLDFRLDVIFRHDQSGTTYRVPGFFAADGDAANTAATAGNKWRVHFSPDQTGTWRYRVSFREGSRVAVSEAADAGKRVSLLDGQSGRFEIAPTNKSGRDHRAAGRLRYVGKRYLQFAETGEYFLKQGADAPENFLAYADFDGDFQSDGHKDKFIKTWEPHIRDWKEGDPTWAHPAGKGRRRGKGIIGAVNYLASEGMNAISFLTLNIQGDDQNVFPYLDYDERLRMDVSRLDQWEIVFEHMDRQGMFLHFKTLETENELLLDRGDLGPERKLYYRELIARFSHHLALNWNLGEEINNASTAQKKSWAAYFADHDPYRHHIVIHNGANHYDLLGEGSHLTGFSLQTNKPDFSQVHRSVLNYLKRSAAAGKIWAVATDEPGDAQHSLRPDDDAGNSHEDARKNALWGTLMAGGWGNEWYFGYRHAHSDLTCQDYRSRDRWWDQCRLALDFFRTYLPFWTMNPADELTPSKKNYCLAQPGHLYAIYLPGGGTTKLDLGEASGDFKIAWFNPRSGGPLKQGSLAHISGPGLQSIGRPPEETKRDWVALVFRPEALQTTSQP